MADHSAPVPGQEPPHAASQPPAVHPEASWQRPGSNAQAGGGRPGDPRIGEPYGSARDGNAPFGTTQYGDTQYDDTQYGNAQYGDTQYGDTQYGDTQYGDTQYGNAQYGNAQYGNAQYGNGPYGSAHDRNGQVPAAPYPSPSGPQLSGEAAHRHPTMPLPNAQGTGAAAAPATTRPRARRTGLLVAAALVTAGVIGGGAGAGAATLAMQSQAGASNSPSATVTGAAAVDPHTIADVAAQAGASVVTVQAASSQAAGEGSGVVVAEGGYIVTNNHVVTLDGATSNASIRVQTSDGRLLDATVVGTDPVVDLAVLKVEADLPVIPFASSDDVQVGDTAIAIGAPLGLANSVTDGIVSAVDRGLQIASSAVPDSSDETQGQSPFGFWQQNGTQAASQDISIPVVQTDASINPGNSGGALLNSAGQLVGVNVAIASMGSSSGSQSGSIGIGFAIESSLVQRVVDEIIANGNATHGLLGASVSDVQDASVGVVGGQVQSIVDGGAAAEAGVREGDVITAVGGAPVTSAVDTTAQVRAFAGGSTTTLTVVRDGEELELEVTLGTLE